MGIIHDHPAAAAAAAATVALAAAALKHPAMCVLPSHGHAFDLYRMCVAFGQ